MRYTTAQILALSNDLVLSTTIASDNHTGYDWIDAIGIPQRPPQLRSSLFFGTYCNGTDGWHTAFDRRPRLQKIIEDRGWHVVVDTTGPPLKGRYMIVSSIKDFSRRIYEDARAKTSPFVIGVTGSVGKTTTVAFLEHLLRVAGYTVTRFWSKRLTPLSIETHYVNRVLPETQFVVLEYSAFKGHHVARLAQALPPDLSFFTNLYNQHIRDDLFKNKKEIYESKIRIKPTYGNGFIHRSVLDNVDSAVPEGW